MSASRAQSSHPTRRTRSGCPMHRLNTRCEPDSQGKPPSHDFVPILGQTTRLGQMSGRLPSTPSPRSCLRIHCVWHVFCTLGPPVPAQPVRFAREYTSRSQTLQRGHPRRQPPIAQNLPGRPLRSSSKWRKRCSSGPKCGTTHSGTRFAQFSVIRWLTCAQRAISTADVRSEVQLRLRRTVFRKD